MLTQWLFLLPNSYDAAEVMLFPPLDWMLPSTSEFSAILSLSFVHLCCLSLQNLMSMRKRSTQAPGYHT